MSLPKNSTWQGYLRPDGRKGIRNVVVVAYLVECAHHIAREIALPYRDEAIHVIGFGGCYPNAYADRMMRMLCTHPNVGGVLLVSLGCESFNRKRLFDTIRESGRPVEQVVIQDVGGTRASIETGRTYVSSLLETVRHVPRIKMGFADLIVGTVSGGSDATSGVTANPAVGKTFDALIRLGSTAMFENTGEMVGLEAIISRRGVTPALQTELMHAVDKAMRYYKVMGHGSFAPGNAEGGLSTIEEKSMGAYVKSGTAPIVGLIKPGDRPPVAGLYLMDIVPDGEPRFGFPNPNDSSEIVELIASGAHCILFTTGRGSVVGSAIAPVIKICANAETYRKLEEDMDINAGKILTAGVTVDELANEILNKIINTASGEPTSSEALCHQEFVLGYKSFEPIGPSCLPS